MLIEPLRILYPFLQPSVDALEDKARIMEVVINPQLFPSEDFVSSPHIMDKLESMNDAVRRTFDTSSWGDDVFWER